MAMTNNLKLRRGWTTRTPKTATRATSHDVAPEPAEPALPRALPPLRDGQVYLVTGSSVFHDHRCDRVTSAFEAGKTIDIAAAASTGKRARCAACTKLADPT